MASAAVTISIPRGANANGLRRRNFVSPSTDGVAVHVTHSSNGTLDYNVTTVYDVAPGSANTCAGTDPEVCTLQIPAPVAPSPDFDTFTFTLYDEAPGGTPPAFGSSAKVLGSGTTTASIIANAANTLSAFVDGLPASIAFGKIVVSGDGYLGFTKKFAVTAYDVDLNPIAGGTYDPYTPAIEVGVNEPEPPAGSTTLSVAVPTLTGLTPPAPQCDADEAGLVTVSGCRSADTFSVTYLQPSTAFDVDYFATLESAQPGVTNTSDLYVSPIFILDTTDPASSTTGPSFTQGTGGTSPVLSLDGGTGTVSLSEPGARTQGTEATFTPNEDSDCNGVIPSGGITATSANSFTITGNPNFSTGTSCKVTFLDDFKNSVVLQVLDQQIVASTPSPTVRRAQGNSRLPSGR